MNTYTMTIEEIGSLVDPSSADDSTSSSENEELAAAYTEQNNKWGDNVDDQNNQLNNIERPPKIPRRQVSLHRETTMPRANGIRRTKQPDPMLQPSNPTRLRQSSISSSMDDYRDFDTSAPIVPQHRTI